MKVCEQRGWSMHWTCRGAYLHLESSELIEAWRGKGGSPIFEAADVLIVLMSIIGAMGSAWNEVMEAAQDKVRTLMVVPKYPGEEVEQRPKYKKFEFKFDERSLASLAELKERGFEFTEVKVRDPETGEERTLMIPKEPVR